MSVDTTFLNAVVNFSPAFIISLIFVAGVRYLKYPKNIQRLAWAVPLVVTLLSTWTVLTRDGVKYAVTDETVSAPRVAGEIKNDRPEIMSDEDRLEYNRQLIEENSIPIQQD